MNKEELIRKIKALAENGIGGEKENAQKMLNELMIKYNIKEEEISEDVIKEFNIKVPRFYNAKTLLVQVLYSVIGKDIKETTKGFYNYRMRGKRYSYVKCTSAEFLEFEAKFKFYATHFNQDVKRFYSAFLQCNKIFPPAGKEIENNQDLTEEDYKMLALARNLERHEYRLQIEEKS